ncbi:MAG TPA: allantoinase AllB [Trueperaceae bacterium]
MDFDLIIRRGQIISPTGSFEADIGVTSGKIAAIGELGKADSERVYDADGKLVFPGFIDEHVHSRDPGHTHKEDFAHSTRAAAAGGVTTIVEMPNSIPPVTDEASFRSRVDGLLKQAFVDFGLWGMVLGDANSKDLPLLAQAGVVGFKLFWGYALDRQTLALAYNPKPGQDVLPPPDDGQIFEAFAAIGKTGRPVAIHAENAEIINRFTDRERRTGGGYASLLRSRPPFTEALTVEAGIRIAEAAGVHLHILHVSSAEAIECVSTARKQGRHVTAETCPHYLVLSDEDFDRLGSRLKIFPPVREARHQAALWSAIQNGDIQVIGSDHAPHTPEEKSQDLWSAPAGASTVQATVPLMLDAVNEGKLSPNQLCALLAENPAKLLGLYPRKGAITPGADADIVIVDMERAMTIRTEDMLSKSRVNPYDGMAVTGAPIASFLRGEQLMEGGKLLTPDSPSGTLVKPV